MCLDVSRDSVVSEFISAGGHLHWTKQVLRRSIRSMGIAEVRVYLLRSPLNPMTTVISLFIPLPVIHDGSSTGIVFSYIPRPLFDLNNAVVIT